MENRPTKREKGESGAREGCEQGGEKTGWEKERGKGGRGQKNGYKEGNLRKGGGKETGMGRGGALETNAKVKGWRAGMKAREKCKEGGRKSPNCVRQECAGLSPHPGGLLALND